MLDSKERKDVKFFIGTEIENTIMKGKRTLFVVGVQSFADILSLTTKNDIDHIYLGTSQSFTPVEDEMVLWNNLITLLLKHNFWVTLDFDVKYADRIHEEWWCESNKFIPMISVKLPYIKLYNYNTTLKIDDTTWGASNPGVWSHSLHELMSPSKFTAWHEYTGDEEVK